MHVRASNSHDCRLVVARMKSNATGQGYISGQPWQEERLAGQRTNTRDRDQLSEAPPSRGACWATPRRSAPAGSLFLLLMLHHISAVCHGRSPPRRTASSPAAAATAPDASLARARRIGNLTEAQRLKDPDRRPFAVGRPGHIGVSSQHKGGRPLVDCRPRTPATLEKPADRR